MRLIFFLFCYLGVFSSSSSGIELIYEGSSLINPFKGILSLGLNMSELSIDDLLDAVVWDLISKDDMEFAMLGLPFKLA